MNYKWEDRNAIDVNVVLNHLNHLNHSVLELVCTIKKSYRLILFVQSH